ncbi:MAG: sigma-70 family RNA polymerase sigma factor [Bacteroidota bacterium]
MHIATKYSESELVAGCQRGESTYQHALYHRYYRLMFGVCLRYTDNKEDAQDILQEGFIKVFKHIQSFKGKGSFEGWVRRIMVHTSIEHYRRNSKYFMVDIQEAKTMQLDADALTTLSREELLEVIQALPVGYRTVFNLYAVEGFSHQEIANMLGISVGTSKSQLSRAKKLLQEKVQQLNQAGSYYASNGE